MFRCDEKYVDRNLWKFYKKEGNLWYTFTKIWAILKENFIEILTKFLIKIMEKFVEILGKLLGMNVAKILKKILGNFR